MTGIGEFTVSNRNSKQGSGIAADIIPFETKNGRLTKHRRSNTKMEAFVVKTDKIFFFAVVYLNKKGRCLGNGYILFEDGNKWCFTSGNNGETDVRANCLRVGRRIARVFGGNLRQGTIDAHGRFVREDGQEHHASASE